MNAEDKKRFEETKLIAEDYLVSEDALWLVSKIEELEEEVREAEVDSAHEEHMRKKADAELTKAQARVYEMSEGHVRDLMGMGPKRSQP